MEIRRPKAYFEMNRRDRVSPHQVHELIREVRRRMGHRAFGAIGFSTANEKGRYVIAFEHVETAVTFERLYEAAGGHRRRQSRPPEGMVLVPTAAMVEMHLLESAAAFVQHVCGHPSHKAHLN